MVCKSNKTRRNQQFFCFFLLEKDDLEFMKAKQIKKFSFIFAKS